MPIAPPAPVFVFRGDISEIHCVMFHQCNDNPALYAGTFDGVVHIFDLTTNKKKTSFKIGNLACLSLFFIDARLLTQDKNCHLKMWNISNNVYSCVFEKNFNNLSFCKIDVLYGQLAIPQPSSVVEIHEYSSTDIRLITRLVYPDKAVSLGEVMQLKMFHYAENMSVAVVYESGDLAIWDIGNSCLLSSTRVTTEMIMSFDFDVDKLQGVCGTNEKLVVFFKMNQQLGVTRRKEIEITNAGVSSLRVRIDKKVIAAGCWDGKVRIFSWKTCKLLAVLDCHRGSILDVTFFELNGSHMLAVAGSDKKISLWSIYE